MARIGATVGRMCGRYTLAVRVNVLQPLFDLAEPPPAPVQAQMALPRYNIAPTQPVLVVRQGPDGRRHASWVRWGLIPPGARDPKVGAKLINARAETLFTQPAFRDAARHRRCLVPTDGFFEWRKIGARKQPYHVRAPDGGVWAMAGIWSTWQDEEGEPVETCSVITTTPNQTLSGLHDRMPVFVPPEQYELWLDPQEVLPNRLDGLLVSAPETALVMVPVADTVNRVKNQGAECLEEISKEEAEREADPPRQFGFGF